MSRASLDELRVLVLTRWKKKKKKKRESGFYRRIFLLVVWCALLLHASALYSGWNKLLKCFTLKRQMIKCLLTEFGRAERENVWRSIRASWPFAPSVGPSPSFNKYIHCSTTDQLPNRRWLPRADWSCKEAKKLTGYAILKLSMTTLRHGNAHLLVHLSKVQNSRVVEFDDRRRLHVICTAITFLS